MKQVTRILASFSSSIAALFLLLGLNACMENEPVLAPQQHETASKFQILEFGESTTSLQKAVSASEFITRRKGGRLHLEHHYALREGEARVKITLDVLPRALKRSKMLGVELDDETCEMEFSEHGTVFRKPAILNIEVDMENISASQDDLAGLDIYYDNPETGRWEFIDREDIKISVDGNNVQIRVVNALLPHFSRYAIGTTFHFDDDNLYRYK